MPVRALSRKVSWRAFGAVTVAVGCVLLVGARDDRRWARCICTVSVSAGSSVQFVMGRAARQASPPLVGVVAERSATLRQV